MKEYEPVKLVAASRYRRCFPTLPAEVREDVYARMRVLIREERAWCDKGNYPPWPRSHLYRPLRGAAGQWCARGGGVPRGVGGDVGVPGPLGSALTRTR